MLKSKKKGGYAIVQIDADYEPKPLETRTVFGVTFEQGRQDLDISNETMLQNVVTENKGHQRRAAPRPHHQPDRAEIHPVQQRLLRAGRPDHRRRCGPAEPRALHPSGRPEGRQLAAAPCRRVLDLPFRADIAKPNRDNAIDVYIGDTPEDVIGDDVWAETFTEQPAPLTAEEKRAWLDAVTGVSLGSDAFFPFGDNIERAHIGQRRTAIVQPGGSIRDTQGRSTCTTSTGFGVDVLRHPAVPSLNAKQLACGDFSSRAVVLSRRTLMKNSGCRRRRA